MSYEKVTGSLVFALAKLDQGEIEEAKQYIVGALSIFDEQYKILQDKENLVGSKVGQKRKSGSSQKKRLKKG
jgi:hypothetical protein